MTTEEIKKDLKTIRGYYAERPVLESEFQKKPAIFCCAKPCIWRRISLSLRTLFHAQKTLFPYMSITSSHPFIHSFI